MKFSELSNRERRDAVEGLTLILALVAVCVLYAMRAKGWI